MLKKFVCALLFCLVVYVGYTQQLPIDHHVHIFSPDLLKNLKINKYGSELLSGNEALYSNIDTILVKNEAQKLCVISTGYGYRLRYINPKNELALQLKEHNFLSSLVNRHPGRILPFYGIDPLKPYAIQLIDRARQFLNFEGVKLHFQASHVDFRKEEHIQSLHEIFTYTGKHNLPLIIHLKNHKSDFGETEVKFFFSDILPEEYSQTIIFAHLGGGGWVTEKSIQITKSILRAAETANVQHNIYFDISAIINEQFQHLESVLDVEKTNLLKTIGVERLLMGSDYPLTSSKDFYKQLKSRLSLGKRQWKKIIKNSYRRHN